MARIRTIKPSFWTDQRVIDLTRDARLLCLGMISHADDAGRIVASAAALIGAIYPHDELTPKQVEKWRDELVAVGLITIYRHGRGTYAAFPGWKKHQYIQKPTPSTLPAPEEHADHTPRAGVDAGPRATSRAPSGSSTGSRSRSGSASGSRSGSPSGAEVEEEVDKEVEVEPGTSPAPERLRATAAR